jgi:hypothetical protein
MVKALSIENDLRALYRQDGQPNEQEGSQRHPKPSVHRAFQEKPCNQTGQGAEGQHTKDTTDLQVTFPGAVPKVRVGLVVPGSWREAESSQDIHRKQKVSEYPSHPDLNRAWRVLRYVSGMKACG